MFLLSNVVYKNGGFILKLVIVSIFDRAAGAFGRPAFVPSKGVAMRSFSEEVNRIGDDNMVNKHPDDFDMFYLGEFDDNNALFALSNPPELLARAKDLVAAPAKQS